MKAVLIITAVFAILILLGTIINQITEYSRSPEEKAARDRDGAHIAAATVIARSLKRSMRDPDSFKLGSVRLIENSDAICYEYRAHNGFGGVNVGHAVLSATGKFKTDEADGFAPLWNKECAHKLGVQVVDAVTFLLNHPTS